MRRALRCAVFTRPYLCGAPLRWRSSAADGSLGVRSLEASPPPPRPAAYIPPEARDPDDPSLHFASPKAARRAGGMGPGQRAAPELSERVRRPPRYADADAARLGTTSVHAGHALLPDRTRAGVGELRGAPAHGGGGGGSVFDVSDGDGEATAAPSAATEPSRLRQMELDLRRLEYYQGSPQYTKLLREFREKYGDDSGATAVGPDAYTEAERDRGLDSQPIDYLRASTRLQAQLSAGPRAYDPIQMMQQMGVMRYQGYAFPPTVELGKLHGADLKLRPNDEDKHVLYRTLGLDAVQRRQARFMLSDFDYGDRHSAFHVMMSYPYTDWIHALYMTLVGLAIYEIQIRFRAYEFYDEYLGLDLRQVPSLKKPFLVVVTVVFMVVAMFHPLLVASIATTRFYRIAMRRPIGPP